MQRPWKPPAPLDLVPDICFFLDGGGKKFHELSAAQKARVEKVEKELKAKKLSIRDAAS